MPANPSSNSRSPILFTSEGWGCAKCHKKLSECVCPERQGTRCNHPWPCSKDDDSDYDDEPIAASSSLLPVGRQLETPNYCLYSTQCHKPHCGCANAQEPTLENGGLGEGLPQGKKKLGTHTQEDFEFCRGCGNLRIKTETCYHCERVPEFDAVLRDVAEKLARSLGHKMTCAFTGCTCGAGEEQAHALYEYENLKRELASLPVGESRH